MTDIKYPLKRVVYQLDNGEMFADKRLATEAQAKRDFLVWYADHQLYAGSNDTWVVDNTVLVKYLIKHRTQINKLLNCYINLVEQDD